MRQRKDIWDIRGKDDENLFAIALTLCVQYCKSESVNVITTNLAAAAFVITASLK